jgi:hypothetical protein
MRHARKMADGLHERLREESRRDIEEWERRQEDPDVDAPGRRPPDRRFYIEADNSAANLKHSLSDAPHGVIFETEFKTLSTVLSQEWGQFRDVLLKGFQNEPVEVGRVTEDPVYIHHPAPSLAVSGTPGTFSEVISDTEDGLFSRFAFYEFDAEPEWKSQFGSVGESPLDAAVDRASKTLGGGDGRNGMYDQLLHRDEPLYIQFTDDAQQKIDDACTFVMGDWKSRGVRPALYSSLKRAAVRALRIACVMRLMRLHEDGKMLGAPKTVEVGVRDALLGLDVAFTYLAHSLRIAAAFGADNDRDGLTRRQQEFLDALPSEPFTTGEAKDTADDIGGFARSAQRWLKSWAQDTTLVQKVKHGVWEKTAPAPGAENVAGVMSVISVISVIRGTTSTTDSPSIDPPQQNGRHKSPAGGGDRR